MEIHPIDSGVIRCICKFEHDDGFTLQCEQCNAWQHGVCVGISTEDEAPEVFLCNRCGKLELDPAKAREKQNAYLKRRNRRRSGDEGKKSRAKDPKDPELVDHPECFYNHIERCDIVAEGSFGRSLATINVLEPEVTIKRVSNHFSQTAFAVATCTGLKRGQLAVEVTGEVYWISKYMENPLNQYYLLGCPKPAVLFIEEHGFVVDSRRRGNEGAFLQRSARPNCRVMAFKDKEGDLRVFAVASCDIAKGALLSVPWTWDARHPIHRVAAAGEESEGGAAIIERSLERLREFGFSGPVEEFLPAPPDEIKVAARREGGQKRRPSESGEPILEFVWSAPAISAPKEDAPKKRLSLADYKKKRPSAG